MLESLIKSMLPEGFDMGAYIEKARIAMDAAINVANTVQRIEQKIDAEIVTLKSRVATLESVHHTEGERNDDRSERDGETA